MGHAGSGFRPRRGWPPALLSSALARASFCEMLARYTGWSGRGADLFSLGLLSNIDAILVRPMSEIPFDLPVANEIRDTLLVEPGAFRSALGLTTAYEHGEWPAVRELTPNIAVPEAALPDLCLNSVQWSRKLNRE